MIHIYIANQAIRDALPVKAVFVERDSPELSVCIGNSLYVLCVVFYIYIYIWVLVYMCVSMYVDVDV